MIDTPTTPTARRDRQLELETLAVDMGVARYREALAKDGNAGVPAGMQLIKATVGPLDAAIKAWLDQTGKGLASRSAGVYHFVNQLDTTVTAWITAQVVLGMLHERPTLPRVAPAVTHGLELALNFEAIAKAQPLLAKKLAKKLDKFEEGRNKAVFIRKGAELADVKVIQWDAGTRLRIGTLLVQLLADSTGLITVETVVERAQMKSAIRPTESCRRWLEESHARCELLTPVRMPMVSPPRNWTSPFNGGYLTHKLRKPLVKTRNRDYLSALRDFEMPWVYAAVNTLQATTWAVNTATYEVAKRLWEAGSTLGGLPPAQGDIPVPPKSWEQGTEPDPEVLQAWKVDAARAYEAEGRTVSKRQQVVQKLWCAELMMQHGNRFHYVYNLDWRGRMYPVGPSLTPQGDDLSKGMLQFAGTSHLGDDGAYWLAVHGANTFGVDKVAFAERITWVQDNEAMILACAGDPYVFRDWADADSPFCFLAFCFEWAGLRRWTDAGNPQGTFASALAVAFDGSCNGLQNFSAMLLDPVGGMATGLIPSDKPADIYSEVARASQAIIDATAQGTDEDAPTAQRWVGKMTRKLAKRNTMTVPYGVTQRGMRDQLHKDLAGSLPEHRNDDAAFLAKTNYTAIGNVVVAARLAMDWLKEAAKVAAGVGKPVQWTSPAGLRVLQDYRVEVGERADFDLLGKRFQVVLVKEGEELNPRKQAMGISPNYVHSLDAAHLMRTVLFCAQEGITEFAMIHDSYGCHAGRATALRDCLRDAFVEQYSLPVLSHFRDELGAQLPPEVAALIPPLPPMGSLDLNLIRQSEYFFA